MPTRTQSVALHLMGTATYISLLIWLEEKWGTIFGPWHGLLISALIGAGWLALSVWLERTDHKQLSGISRLTGALTLLAPPYLPSFESYLYPAWYVNVFELLTFLGAVAFIAANLWQQSRAFLYSGAAFLLLILVSINFRYFADELGMPVALFISGVLLVALGLGTTRLNNRLAPV